MFPRLLRYQIFLAYGAAFLAIWWSLVLRIDVIVDALSPTVSRKQVELAVRYAPLWAVLVLGLYAFLSVVHGVAMFRDCPEAALEIERHVKQAREALKRKGVEL